MSYFPQISGTVVANAGVNLNTSALALETGNLSAINSKLATLSAVGQNATAVSQTATYFQPSTANSSTAQLGAGATFTGTVETIYNQQAISILIVSDQPGTLTVKQYIDAAGLRLASSVTYTITAGQGFSRSIVANGNYFNLVFQNTGGSSTTTLNIDTAFGTLLPMTQSGNLPVSMNEIGTSVTLPVSTAQLPVSLGQKSSANSTSVAIATDQVVQLGATTSLSSQPVAIATDQLVPLGQTIKANSIPVVLPSDQTVYVNISSTTTVLPVSGTFWQGVQPISATQLPTSLGQTVMANSLPVVLPSDQTVFVRVSSSIVLPVSSVQLTASLGQTTKSASLPVVLPSDQLGPQQVAAAVPTTMARKLAVTGFPSVATTTTYTNLLDNAAGTAALDVRDYNTALIAIVSTATTGSYTIQGSFDSGATIGLITLQAQETTVTTGAAVINAAITPTAATRVFRVNIADVNYLRVNLSTGVTTGTIQAYATLSQATPIATELVAVQSTLANLNATANVSQFGGTNVVTGGVAGIIAVGGNIAHSTAATANPVPVGGRVITTLDTTLANNDTCYQMFTTAGQLIIKPFGSAENDWQVSTTVTTSTQTAIKAAGAASIRNYVTCITYQNTNATATTLTIQDGATTMFQFSAAASMANPVTITFPTPLKGTAATAVNYTAGTTGANVLLNVQGYQSF